MGRTKNLISSGFLYSTRPFLKGVLVFCVGAIIGIMGIQFVPIQLDVQMRTKEQGYLQYFVDTGAGFNEMQSKRIRLSESADFLDYRASIRANGLRAIRIDPLEAQGQFELLGLQIEYLFWHRQWYGKGELNHLVLTHEIDIKSTGGAAFFGQAMGNDPGLVITDVAYFSHVQRAATMFCALFGGAAALLLLVVIHRFGGLKTVLAYRHTSLAIIVIAAILLRIIYWEQSGFPSEPSQLFDFWVDEGTYFSVAQYIMTHGLTDYFLSEQSLRVAPANPIYIALMYSIFNSIEAIRSVNLLISVLTIVLIYKLSKTMFNKPIGLLAAGICALNALHIHYSPTLMTEPLFLFLFIAAIYYLVLTIGAPEGSFYHAHALASAVFLALAILTRSIALLLPFFILAMIGTLETWLSWRMGKPSFPLLKRAALPLLLPMLIVGIVAIKNYVFFDRFMIATGSGSALWLGSRVDTEGDDPLIRKREYGVLSITGELDPLSLQGDLLLMAAAKKNILENPAEYTWWGVLKIGRLAVGNNLTWFGSHKNVIDWNRSTNSKILATAKLIFQIILSSTIAVYGVIGLLIARPVGASRLLVASTIVYLVLFSIPFLALQRYGLPLQTLLVIPASAVIYGAWFDAEKMRRAALLGLPIILAIVLQILFWNDR